MSTQYSVKRGKGFERRMGSEVWGSRIDDSAQGREIGHGVTKGV